MPSPDTDTALATTVASMLTAGVTWATVTTSIAAAGHGSRFSNFLFAIIPKSARYDPTCQ